MFNLVKIEQLLSTVCVGKSDWNTQNMNSILVLLFVVCIFSVVFGAETQVQVGIYGRPILPVVHYIGSVESTNAQISYDHGISGNDALTGQIRITHNDHDGRQDRTEIHLSGVGHAGTGGNIRSTTGVRGSLGNGQIVAYGTRISVPGYITGNIKLY